ncbi:MAG: T9SS type A sorting domain-containing protein [Bacteroidales bacterium]|nr:T9SS type A sorting domain-containing protein [Bacteroidales bacterium]
MKRITLFLVILMACHLTKAQSYASLVDYSFGWYIQYMENFVELQDGNILTCTRLFNLDDAGHYTTDHGYCFLKLNREDASIMDSVFVPDNYTNCYLLEPHPSQKGYLFINQVYDSLTGSNFMKIRNFNDDLVFEDGICVPLTDTVYGGTDHFLLEEESFIMESGDGNGSHVFQRFGLDGTLKDRVVYPDSVCPYWESSEIKVWKDNPREYVFTGYKGSTRHCFFYVLDSLLNLRETIALEHTPQYPNVWFKHHGSNTVEALDESTYLLATPFEKYYVNGTLHQKGVQVTKRDKATHTNLKTVYFPFHVISVGKRSASPYVVDVRQTEEGHIYIAYGDLSGLNRFSVALLDSELNILWQNYYLNLVEWDHMCHMEILGDGGLGMVGFNSSRPIVFALFVNNDYDALEEQGIIVRPYAYWPNPAQDELHLQYSPDVKPTQIELYDLQGRLVRSQRNGLESLNLQGLSSGTYTMRITLEGGKVFSDKVVKN